MTITNLTFNTGNNVEIIGYSENKKPMNVVYLGDKSQDKQHLRVFIIAGQHGDERHSRVSVNRIMSDMNFNMKLPLLQLAILPDANPDGSHQRTRANANGIDLNRDHQRLESEETRLIHSFVRKWKPHLIIDVHNYPSKRKHLLANNHVICQDVFLDIPTNMSIQLDQIKSAQLLNVIKSELESSRISCDRYTIITPTGRVRHSTPDVTDARNSLALRYNVLTILLEGRDPTRGDDPTIKEHLIAAQTSALYSILEWAQANKDSLFNSKPCIPSEKDSIVISSKYVKPNDDIKIKLRNSITKKIETVSFPKYTPNLEATKSVELPTAYAIPVTKVKVIEILSRHGFKSQYSDSNLHVQYYIVKSAQESKNKNKSARNVVVETRTEHRRLDDYVIFPIRQEGGNTLAVFLEPESKYGLSRYADLNLPLLPNSIYPVLRITHP